MDDTISRQAAIDWLTNEWDGMVTSVFDGIKNLPSAQPEKVCIANVTLSEETLKELVEKAKAEIVQSMPTVIEPEQRWIPCSERLPEKEEMYLVSGDSEIWMCEFIRIGFTRGWSNPANCPVVKAWMPLPEPYKEGQDE